MKELALISGFAIFPFLGLMICSFRISSNILVRIGLCGFLSFAILVSLALCWFSVYSILVNRSLPNREDTIARIQHAALRLDRSAVMSELRAAGFKPELHQGSYSQLLPEGVKSEKFSEKDIAHSASYITLAADRVRSKEEKLLMEYEYVGASFLFDSHDRLIAWHHEIYSPSL